MSSVLQKNKKPILYVGLVLTLLGIIMLILTQLSITCGRNAYFITTCIVFPTYTDGVYLGGIDPLILDFLSLFISVIGLILVYLGIESKNTIIQKKALVQKNNTN